MTEISSARFMELTVHDVSDLLMKDIGPDRQQSGALLYGKSKVDGRRYKLSVVLQIDE